MKDPNTPSTVDQRNYALRRIIYNTMIAAKSLHMLPLSGKDFSQKELAKVAGLIMARNLDDFFFKQQRDCAIAIQKGKTPNPQASYKQLDDIFVSDFALSWVAPSTAMIPQPEYQRINKLAGHVVAIPPKPFKDDAACQILKPLILVAVDFVRASLTGGNAVYTGKATYYVPRLNGTLAKLGLQKLPT